MKVVDSRSNPPVRHQKAASVRWWLLSVPLVGLAGCTFEELPPLPDYAVGGTLRGIWDGASAELALTSEGRTEALTLETNGSFVFARRLPADTSYSIELAEPVLQHDCVVTNGAGTVGANDVDTVTVDCTGPVPIAIEVANPLGESIDTTDSSHTIGVSLLQQTTQVIVTAPGATSITLDGAQLASGFPSAERRLDVGENVMTIRVNAGELSRDLRLILDRGQLTVPTEYGYLKASNLESGDLFGVALAAAGNALWVGAAFEDSSTPNGSDNAAADSGAVYVFERDGAAWAQTHFFKSTYAPGARFGERIAANADIAFVAAPGEDREHESVGSIYRFRRSTATWLGLSRMGPANPEGVWGYGSQLALHGDVLAVSDQLPGSVHILRGPMWTEERVLHPSHIDTSDKFARHLALHGDLLVVSAHGDSSGGAGVLGTAVPTNNDAIYSGAIYVYRSDGGAWNLDSFIKSSNADPYDKFGLEVAFDGDTLVVAAPDEASGTQAEGDNSAPGAGAVYVFRRESGSWRQEAYLKSPDPRANQYFGISIAVAGDLIAIGELAADEIVHLYQRKETGWTWVAALRASNGDRDDNFAAELVLTDHGLVASSSEEDGNGTGPENNSSPNSGAVYTFR